MTDKTSSAGQKPQNGKPADTTRRNLITAGAVAGGALLMGAPYIRNAEAAKSTTWKVQSSWDAGTTGFKLFEEWANSFKEKSGGELAIKPFPAKAVAADNNALFDAVRTGVLQAMNPFTLYWSGKIPASVFLSSYPAGPDQTSHWDTMFYGLGMQGMTRDIFKKFGLYYVGPIQHDANIIHSKKPVTSLKQLKGMKVRLPGGMVAQVFEHFYRNNPIETLVRTKIVDIGNHNCDITETAFSCSSIDEVCLSTGIGHRGHGRLRVLFPHPEGQ